MRKRLYLGFSGVLLVVILLLTSLNVSWMAIAGLFIILAGIAIYDVLQKEHAVLRNFPILGHLRYLLESLGPEIRQYIPITPQDANKGECKI